MLRRARGQGGAETPDCGGWRVRAENPAQCRRCSAHNEVAHDCPCAQSMWCQRMCNPWVQGGGWYKGPACLQRNQRHGGTGQSSRVRGLTGYIWAPQPAMGPRSGRICKPPPPPVAHTYNNVHPAQSAGMPAQATGCQEARVAGALAAAHPYWQAALTPGWGRC